MRRWMLSLMAVAAVLVAVSSLWPASAQSAGAVPWGSWAWRTHLAPTASLPALVTFHADGTVTGSDGLMFGGLPGSPTRMSPIHGVWEHTGRHSIGGTSLYLVFDAPSGVLIAIGRARSSLHFVTDFDHLQGRMFLESLPCPSPVACPDPLAEDAGWISYPGMPPDGFAVSATRVHRVPAGPLVP